MAEQITVVGSGAWGTTLALTMAQAGRDVTLYCRNPNEAGEIFASRENRRKLPGVSLPASLKVSSDLSSVANAQIIFFVVPSQTMRANAAAFASLVQPGSVLVSATKGLELGSIKRMSEILAEEVPQAHAAALSGPNLAQEVVEQKPATSVVAAADLATATRVQDALMTLMLRIYTNTDLVGVELCGALKNIIALAAGVCDGLEIGDNAKSALITRGLAEMGRLGLAAGAQLATFAGLAGLGDVIATCASKYSRNRYLGQELARGRKLDEIRASMGHIAEGVTTTQAAMAMAARYNIEMPITAQLHAVLFEGRSVQQAIMALLSRDRRDEQDLAL